MQHGHPRHLHVPRVLSHRALRTLQVPAWTQRTNLHRALKRQFAEGLTHLDSDHIFGKVITRNLEEIFDNKKLQYQRRTSSGN